MQEKRLADCIRAAELVTKTVTLYEDFNYLYRCVLSELDVFDRNGNLRDRKRAEAGIEVGFALIEESSHQKITKAVNKSRRTLPHLLHYFDVAKNVVDECRKLPIGDESLKAYCLAWQWGKAVRKAKNTGRKNSAQEHEQFYMDIAEGLNQEESVDVRKEIYSKLDKIVQSSALVECINSIIRPYLNTCKNQVSQKMLNLVMHYHNHRRYRDGVRKDKTPMEILTGEEQAQDWISIIFDIIKEKDPDLLFAS